MAIDTVGAGAEPAAPTAEQRVSRRPAAAALLRAGAVGGAIAGAAFAVHLALIAEVAAAPTTDPGIRSSTWTPFTGIATFAAGSDALHGSLWPGYVALGLALHLAVSIVVGIVGTWWIYVCLGTEFSPALGAAVGAAYGLFVEVVAVQFVVNPLQEPNVVYQALPPWAWWAGHGVYGIVLGVVAGPLLRRR